jgi:type IV secretion system protein VirB10
MKEEKKVDASTVNVTVNQGDDLEKLRQLEEARRRAEEERRRAEEEARLAELEAKRREEEEKARWERLRSDQIIVDGNSRESLAGEEQAVTIAEDGQLVAVPGAESDANKAFLAQSEKQAAGIVKATRFDRTDALVAQGTMIRGFLETAINTDLPGMVRAVVREDVRSLDGTRILIPKGSPPDRGIQIRNGAGPEAHLRRLVAGHSVRWPLRRDRLAGCRPFGAARGLPGRSTRISGSVSAPRSCCRVIGGAAEFVSALGDTATEAARTISTIDPITGAVTTITTEPSRTASEARSIAAEKSSGILQEIANEAFKDSAKIPPTIHVAQGEAIIVYLRRDLDFSDFYADPLREEMTRLRRGGAIRRSVDPTPLLSDCTGLQMSPFPFLVKALERLRALPLG